VTGVWGVNFNPDKTDEIFDEWGAEGWELEQISVK